MNMIRAKLLVAIIPLVVIAVVPLVSLIAAHSELKTEAAITPSISPCHEAGYNAGVITLNGLLIITFDTPLGKIKINLPDDLAAGDTVSGTVNVEPAGPSKSERDKNETELSGYVIDIGGQKKNLRDRMISLVIPATQTITLIHLGQPVATSEIPVSTTPLPAPNKFTLPTGGQHGRTIEIKGPFNGAFMPQDSVKIGETTAPPIAESPRKIVVMNNSPATGPTKIQINENGTTTECPFRNIKINLSAPKTDLKRGEKTEMHVEVLGLSGLTQNVPLKLENASTAVVSMSGGEIQNSEINARAVQNGSYSLNRTLTGIQPGSFRIDGTVTWTDTCTGDPTGGPISGGPGPVSQPPPSPTPLTPTDTADGEVCKWINYKTYRVDEFKRVQSTNSNLEVKNESAHGGGTAVSFHCKAAGVFIFTVTKESGDPDVVSVTCK
jgi:hypothetical protein